MDRADLLRKVRALIDKADSTTFQAEADAFRAKADAMMVQFAIEEFELEMAKPAHARQVPEVRTYTYFDDDYYKLDPDYREQLTRLFYTMAVHCRCKVGFYGYKESKVVGYAADLDYLDLLFTSVRLHMSSKITPTPTPALSWEQNLAVLKEAGYKWEKIHYMMAKAELPDYPYNRQPWERKIGVRFTKVYTDHCKASGKERNYDAPQVWKRSFVQGYVWEIQRRIQEMAKANQEVLQSNALVLHGMEDRLNEALWEAFPNLKPHPKGCDCDACHRCNDPKCQRVCCVNARKPIRYVTTRERKFSASAMTSGQAAGKTFNLARGEAGGRRKEIG